jgi:hypothetical protein
MQERPRPPSTIVMLIRLWQERLDAQHSEWRGAIKNVTTGEVRYFRGWEEIAHTIAALLAHDERPDRTGPTSQDGAE